MNTHALLRVAAVCAAATFLASPTLTAADTTATTRTIAYRNTAKPGSPCAIRLTSDFKDGKIEFWKTKGTALKTLSAKGDGYSVIPDPKLNNSLAMTITYKPGMLSDPTITLALSGGSLKAPVEFKCKLGKKITLEPVKEKSLKPDARGYFTTDDYSANAASVEGDPLIVFK